MDNSLSNILTLIQAELSPSKVLSILIENEPIVRNAFESEPNDNILTLYSSLKKEIIYLTLDTKKREAKWDELLKYLEKWKAKIDNKEFQIEYAYTLIDFLEDQIAFNPTGFLENKILDKLLLKNITVVNTYFENTSDYRFLILKGTYLRFKARYFCKLFTERVSRIDEALRCLQKAESLNDKDSNIYIQKGLCLFFKSAINSKTFELYTTAIKQAEENFLKAVKISNSALSYLSLCFFYRFTFQPDACCSIFIKYTSIESNKRRLYRNSYIFGEAANSLSYRNRPEEILNAYLTESNKLLSDAINSGYEFPRLLVAKAFTLACLNKLDIASNLIFKLFSKDQGFTWNQFVEISDSALDDYQNKNYIDNAIINGITDSSIWNNLGTFSRHFLKDNYLAENCYRIAKALSPNNTIILTNLARLLIKIDIKEYYNEISYLLEIAEEKSDSRFYWWMQVKNEFEEMLSKIDEEISTKYDYRKKTYRKDDYFKIIQQFNILKEMEDEYSRGIQFESFITNLLRRCNINSLDSYKNAIGEKTYTQIDGACVFDSKYYLIETKWTSSKAGVDAVRQLLDKMMNGLDDNYGLLISISGFTQDAIDTAQRNILKNMKMILVDGEELELIINNNCIVDALLSKQIALHLRNNCYYKYSLTNQNIA